MKVIFNTQTYNYSNQYIKSNQNFRADTSKVLHEVTNEISALGGIGTATKRIAELGQAQTETEAWKVAMKMADYGNPVRHAAWMAGVAKGAALGSFLGPVGTVAGSILGGLCCNYLCNKVRNKVIDTIGDWADE